MDSQLIAIKLSIKSEYLFLINIKDVAKNMESDSLNLFAEQLFWRNTQPESVITNSLMV